MSILNSESSRSVYRGDNYFLKQKCCKIKLYMIKCLHQIKDNNYGKFR